MNTANIFTLLRIILAPVFFVIYMLLRRFSEQFSGEQLFGIAIWIVPLLWVTAIFAELTDMFDGIAARRLNQGSDFGKLFDPFADTVMQLTGFLCFVIDGIFPAILFLVVLYREFGILFLRNLFLRKGIAMGARKSGKLKTVSYITAAAAALFYASLKYLGILESFQEIVKITAIVIFGLSVLISVISFFDYLFVYRSAEKKPIQESVDN